MHYNFIFNPWIKLNPPFFFLSLWPKRKKRLIQELITNSPFPALPHSFFLQKYPLIDKSSVFILNLFILLYAQISSDLFRPFATFAIIY